MLSGNDISNFQGNINYDIYKNNSNFVIVKATEGTSFTDPYLIRNQLEARRVNLPLGYYHFAHPDAGNFAIDEADYFLTKIGKLHQGELLCLDYEVNYSDPVNWCKSFLDRIFQQTNTKPLIYLNKSQVTNYDWTKVAQAGYGLWLASYDDNVVTGAWPFLAIQQWTDAQQVPGINGNIDGDRFFGTLEQFKAYGYQSKSSPSSSVSPSNSPSSSFSPSLSISASASPSDPPNDEVKYHQLIAIIYGKWTWIGVNGWISRLHQLKRVLET